MPRSKKHLSRRKKTKSRQRNRYGWDGKGGYTKEDMNGNIIYFSSDGDIVKIKSK